MDPVYKEVMSGAQKHYRRLKHLTQFYHRFAGAIIRIQQDRDCLLTDISTSGSRIDLTFEEEDKDGFSIQLKPWRNDLVFVSTVGYWAQVTCELFRFCPDPTRMQKANEASIKSYYSGIYGQRSGLVEVFSSGRPQPLDEPGVVKIRTVGNKVCVSTQLIFDLGEYSAGEGRFHRDRIEADLAGISYGLDKCLHKMTNVPTITPSN